MSETEKKGITVKIDAGLHAQVKEFIEANGMTMAEFVSKALDDELHPKMQIKEEKYMGAMRTMAFQVPQELFDQIKDYLERHNMTQKQFVIGLIQAELDRDQAMQEGMTENEPAEEELDEEENEGLSEDDDESEDLEEDEDLDESEDMEESEDEGMAMGM